MSLKFGPAFLEMTCKWLNLRLEEVEAAVTNPDHKEVLPGQGANGGSNNNLYLKDLRSTHFPRAMLVLTSTDQRDETVTDAWTIPHHWTLDDPTPVGALKSLCGRCGLTMQIADRKGKLFLSESFPGLLASGKTTWEVHEIMKAVRVLDNRPDLTVRQVLQIRPEIDGTVNIILAYTMAEIDMKKRLQAY